MGLYIYLQLHTTRRFMQLCAVYFDLAALDTISIQSGLIVDADEDCDTILGYLDSGLGGDLWSNLLLVFERSGMRLSMRLLNVRVWMTILLSRSIAAMRQLNVKANRCKSGKA